MNVTYIFLLFSILISCTFCQANYQIQRPSDSNSHKTVHWRNDPEEQQKNILTRSSRDISSSRTIIPSFRVILLEVSFMAISIYLVNSLENYIQQKSKTIKPKNKLMDGDFFENFKNILQSFENKFKQN